MGRAIDQSGIQFRMLNSSRGAAVRGPRAQTDRTLYKKAINEFVNGQVEVCYINLLTKKPKKFPDDLLLIF